uniref:Negatively light-regulated protein n=1 Tax=Chenopodium quinoa TaxID=63459 RepID=A0A803M485_CHEQI
MEEDGSRSMPSTQEQEATLKKKYGGIVPKKPPLISKDHERAYFDSADWALGKQGVEKPKGPLEALRPKLQHPKNIELISMWYPKELEPDFGFEILPTQQQTRYRKSPCAPTDGEDGENAASEEPAST